MDQLGAVASLISEWCSPARLRAALAAGAPARAARPTPPSPRRGQSDYVREQIAETKQKPGIQAATLLSPRAPASAKHHACPPPASAAAGAVCGRRAGGGGAEFGRAGADRVAGRGGAGWARADLGRSGGLDRR